MTIFSTLSRICNSYLFQDREGMTMKGKRTFSIFLLLVLLLGGLFGPPLQGQGVSAAPLASYTVFIKTTVLNAPQKKMCLGNTAYFSIEYEIKKYQIGSGGVTALPPPAGEYALTISATNGTISPSSAPLSNTTGSGIIPVTFKATTLGKAKISINSRYSAGNSFSFQVVNCTWKVMIEADERNVANPIKQYIKFQGEGGIDVAIDPTAGRGTLTGNGTFRYTMTYAYVNSNPNLTCEDISISSGDSTFSITHGTLVANAVAFGIQLATVKMPASVAKCVDANGTKVEVPANQAMTISDPNIPEFNNLVFPDGTNYLPFAFGDGRAGVYLVQRKVK